ncbi:C-type lectin domain family 4 member M [Merluccius polli]|uniref:C-type lectin domain family 4 member M n=1 Tax=Merluccius polli TaxID=89951 RepID=A0AA47P7U8_MERPO|nr:C-type lectin domain family 4 member M [Merluccius polli]
MYYNHRLYYISTAKKNRAASRDDCLERDADLVVINSREEQEFVSRQAGPYWTWIGLSDGDTEGTWKWVDGTNMTSSFWRRGQPNDYGGGEDCVVTSLGKDWRDASCGELFRWMCEKVLVLDHLEAELNKEVMRGEPPQIYDPPSSKTVSVGDTVIFSCRAGGRPQPTIQWLLDGRLLETDGTDNRSESVVRMDEENLVLRGVRSGVETFLCMATNSAGTANHTAWLLVYEVRPDGWLHFDHRLYFISTTKKNWAASRDDCLERDADLVVINSREEQEFVTRQLGYQWFWIGLSAGDTEGTWKWVDGTIMTSSFWLSGEPNDAGGAEDCVSTREDGWNDAPCAYQYHWICEKVRSLLWSTTQGQVSIVVFYTRSGLYCGLLDKVRSLLWSTKQEVRPDGWLHFDHSLYFISTAKKNWTASRVDCLERDAYLVVINSREEQEFVRRQAGGQWFWIGLSDRDTEGTWKWVDGTIMTSSFWESGQPDDYGGAEDCVSTRGNGWYDDPCAYQYRWICEKV